MTARGPADRDRVEPRTGRARPRGRRQPDAAAGCGRARDGARRRPARAPGGVAGRRHDPRRPRGRRARRRRRREHALRGRGRGALRPLLQRGLEPLAVVRAPLPVGRRAHADLRPGHPRGLGRLRRRQPVVRRGPRRQDREAGVPRAGLPPRLVPRLLRELRPDARISHFSHTPFAGADVPADPAHADAARPCCAGCWAPTCAGSTRGAWADNFLHVVPDAAGSPRRRAAPPRHVRGPRDVACGSYPISVEAARSARPRRSRRSGGRGRTSSGGGATRSCCCASTGSSSRRTSRAGSSRTSVFLKNRPEWQGRVRFLAMLSPSRVRARRVPHVRRGVRARGRPHQRRVRHPGVDADRAAR